MTTHAPSVISLLLGAGLAVGAAAQNALDANLRVGSGGVNDVVQANSFEFRDEVAFRNAFVTGNVGGLGGFRGDIGYSATDDFRGDLGSNDSFSFLAQSSSSAAVATRGVSSLGALQQSLAFSQAFQTQGFNRQPIILMAGAGATASSVSRPAEQPLYTDVFGQIRGSLRNTAGAVELDTTRPRPLAQQVNEDGETQLAVGSQILGLRMLDPDAQLFNPRPRYEFEQREEDANTEERIDPNRDQEQEQENENSPPGLGAARIGATPVDAAQLSGTRSGELTGLGLAYQQFREPAAQLGLLEAGAIPEPLDPALLAAGDDEASRTNPDGSVQPEEPEWVTQIRVHMDALRAELAGHEPDPLLGLGAQVEERLATAGQGEEAAPGVGSDLLTNHMMQRLAGGGADNADGNADAEDNPGTARVAPQVGQVETALELIRSAPVRVLRLSTPLDTGAVYREHMTQGELMLEEGLYFTAEERFTAALSVRPGDAMAAVGRISAQLSAGLFRSGALNLRNLYRAYPELLRARFAGPILPTDARADRLAELLRERIAKGGSAGADAALLLAFMGFQRNDDAHLTDGLAGLDQLAGTMPEIDHEVSELVIELWSQGE